MERISEEVITRNEPLREEAGDYQIWQWLASVLRESDPR
jgi:hypothetical protein